MSQKIFVSNLELKEEIESVFLVKYIAVQTSKDGRDYLNVVLSDSSGDLECRAWHGAKEIASRIQKGDFVRVKGKLNLYQGRKQFVVQSILKDDGQSIKQEDFIAKSKSSPDAMFEELVDIVDALDDVYIRDLLRSVLFDTEVQRRLKFWPAGKTIHHAYQSGLLEHVLSCTQIALFLAPRYKCNKNYVVAGTILHDLGKIYELSDGLNTDYTEEGKLIGHLPKGLEIIDRYAMRIRNFPHQMKLHLKHIMLAHHGEYEYGAPKLPQTSEAYLVHLIDLLDSKMATMDAIKQTDAAEGNWSSFVKHLDRIVYKSELPTYLEYIPEEDNDQIADESKDKKEQKEQKEQKDTDRGSRNRGEDRELKQSLGKLLSGLKIDDN